MLFLWERRRISIPDKTESYMPIFEKDFKRIYCFFFWFFFFHFSVIPNRFKGDYSYTGVFFCRIRIEGQTNNTNRNNKHSKPLNFNILFASCKHLKIFFYKAKETFQLIHLLNVIFTCVR